MDSHVTLKSTSEDCTDFPLKARCTKAARNRQVHYNPVYEEVKGNGPGWHMAATFSEKYGNRKKLEINVSFFFSFLIFGTF